MLHQADPDSDHDGLPDTWELVFFGNLTHGPNEDADGDGATNLGESIAGTDPTDPASVLRLFIDRVGDHPRLRFPTVAGRLYLILSNTDLGPVWLPVWSAIAGDGTEKSIILEEGFTDPRRFYRVEVRPIL
jgi:hypothetical protein